MSGAITDTSYQRANVARRGRMKLKFKNVAESSQPGAAGTAKHRRRTVDDDSSQGNRHKRKERRRDERGDNDGEDSNDKDSDNEGGDDEQMRNNEARGRGPPVPCLPGLGRVVSTGTTLNGFETNFKDEVEAGDTILVNHPVSLKLEKRLVASVLSQRCLTLGDGFSRDLVSTASYEIRKDSITLKREAAREAAKTKEALRETEHSQSAAEAQTDVQNEEGEVGAGHASAVDAKMMQDIVSRRLQQKIEQSKKAKLTYRVKTGMWSYKTVSEEIQDGENFGADELLERRAKKSRDKHCW